MSTAVGLKISAVNGTALLDTCPADVLAAVGSQIKITQSGHILQGVISSVGVSEGLGVEKLVSANAIDDPDSNEANATTGWFAYNTPTTFESTSSGTPYAGSYHFHCVAGADNKGYGSGAITLISTALYKHNSWLKVVSGGDSYIETLYIDLAVLGGIIYNDSTYANKINYRTVEGTTLYIRRVSQSYRTTKAEWYEDNASLKQVTAPSSSGVVIKDLSNNQNWITNTFANTDYNQSSYSYIIIPPIMARRGFTARVGSRF